MLLGKLQIVNCNFSLNTHSTTVPLNMIVNTIGMVSVPFSISGSWTGTVGGLWLPTQAHAVPRGQVYGHLHVAMLPLAMFLLH